MFCVGNGTENWATKRHWKADINTTGCKHPCKHFQLFSKLWLLDGLLLHLLMATQALHCKSLTLMSATSGSLARCGGGRHLPYLSWLWSKFWPKNHVSLKAGINSNSFGHFSEFFFQKSQKNGKNCKSI